MSAQAPKMNRAKRSAKAVVCKNASVTGSSALEAYVQEGVDVGSENIGLSNANSLVYVYKTKKKKWQEKCMI